MASSLRQTREYRGLSAVVIGIVHEKAPSAFPGPTWLMLVGSATLLISTTIIAELLSGDARPRGHVRDHHYRPEILVRLNASSPGGPVPAGVPGARLAEPS